jgi:hypothetical protein
MPSKRQVQDDLIDELEVQFCLREAEQALEQPLWSPLPGPQLMAYTTEADELFYGGQAGGGKSDLILGLAFTSHQNSIIFRREYPQLKGLIQRARKILKPCDASYNSQEKTWGGIPGDRVLELGAVQYEESVEKYQGRPHDLKAFDEITHFSKLQYKFLTGWARTSDENQRVRIVCTGNPPTTAEGRWVIEYWAPWLDPKHPNPAVPGELRWFAVLNGEDVEVDGCEPFEYTNPEGETELITPRSRTFIPASVDDNPYYAKTGYKAVLQGLPEPLRSQMLRGDFTAGIEDDPWQIIPTEWIEAAFERWRRRPQPDQAQTSLGVDPARGGRDKTVMAPAFGDWVGNLLKHPGSATPDGPTVAGLAMAAAAEGVAINIDVCAIGSSPFDSLLQLGANAIALNGSEAAKDARGKPLLDRSKKIGFINLRAYWHWRLRELLDPAYEPTLALPPDPELLADLSAPRYRFSNWRVQVEDKGEIKKRIGRSPDCGEAVIYAVCPETPQPVVIKRHRPTAVTNW